MKVAKTVEYNSVTNGLHIALGKTARAIKFLEIAALKHCLSRP